MYTHTLFKLAADPRGFKKAIQICPGPREQYKKVLILASELHANSDSRAQEHQSLFRPQPVRFSCSTTAPAGPRPPLGWAPGSSRAATSRLGLAE